MSTSNRSLVSKLFAALKKSRVLLVAMACYWLADGLDIASSLLSNGIPGLIEGNTLIRDPVTFQFVLSAGLFLKGAYFLLVLCPLVGLILLATRSQLLASIPLFYGAYELLPVAWANFMLACKFYRWF